MRQACDEENISKILAFSTTKKDKNKRKGEKNLNEC